MAYDKQKILKKIQVLWDIGSNVLSIFDNNILALAGNKQTIDQYLFKKITNILSADDILSIFQTYWVKYLFCNPTNSIVWSA